MSSCSSVSDGSSDETADTTSAESSRPSDATQASSQRPRNLVPAASVLIALIAVAVVLFTGQPASWLSSGTLPLNPREAADEILSKAPVIVRPAPPLVQLDFAPQLIAVFFPLLSPLFLIRRVLPVDGFVSDECQDGHIDLAWLMRLERSNNATAIDLNKPTIGHVDIPRLRAGHVGGFFWCVNLLCRSKCHLPHSRLTGRYTYLVQKIVVRIQEKTFSRQPRACGRFSLSLCYIHKMNRLSVATRWNR